MEEQTAENKKTNKKQDFTKKNLNNNPSTTSSKLTKIQNNDVCFVKTLIKKQK